MLTKNAAPQKLAQCCRVAHWKFTWTCERKHVTRNFTGKLLLSGTRRPFCANLCSRNAQGHIVTVSFCRNLAAKCRRPGYHVDQPPCLLASRKDPFSVFHIVWGSNGISTRTLKSIEFTNHCDAWHSYIGAVGVTWQLGLAQALSSIGTLSMNNKYRIKIGSNKKHVCPGVQILGWNCKIVNVRKFLNLELISLPKRAPILFLHERQLS